MSTKSPTGHFQSHVDLDNDAKDPVPQELALDLGPEPEPTHKRFFWWDLPRRQWIWAVAGCSFLALVVLLLIIFLAIVPAIFQAVVNCVHLTANHLDLLTIPTDPTVTKVGVELSLHAKHNSIIGASTHRARAKLYYQGSSFAAIYIPPQVFKHGSHEHDIVIRDDLEITDLDVFTTFSKALVTDSAVEVKVKATVTAHALGMTYGSLDLKQTLTIPAFHQFNDVHSNLTSLYLHTCSTGDKFVAQGNVTLDNVGAVGLNGVGALNLSVHLGDSFLAYGLTPSGFEGIVRGPNALPLELYIGKDPQSIKLLQALVNATLATTPEKPAVVTVTADSDNATIKPALKAAFKELKMNLYYSSGASGISLNTTDCNLTALMAA